MSDNISLKTWIGELNTPLHDAIIRDTLTQMNGMYKGGEVVYTSANILHINAGYGMIKGRLFEIHDDTIAVTLPQSGTYHGRVYIHIDLSNADEPITIETYTGITLPALTKDENMNFDNGIYELEICTFEATANAVTDLTMTIHSLTGVFSRIQYSAMLGSANMDSSTTSFNDDGSITTEYAGGNKTVTEFESDGSIVTTLYDIEDNIIATKTTTFNDDGSIESTVQEV